MSKIWLIPNFLRLILVVRALLLVRGAMARGGMVGGAKNQLITSISDFYLKYKFGLLSLRSVLSD